MTADAHVSLDQSAKIAWFHCFSGIAGDMTLGSLIDAGADISAVRSMCERLPIGGWSLEAEETMRGGIGATKVSIDAEPTTVVRTAAHIAGLVEEARLPERLRHRAQSVFERLAVAEGRLHRRPPQQVHFHEVGGIDAIIDVVGTCAALEVLGIDQVWCSPVANGIGMVRSAHGVIPNPAPAVIELLKGAPTYALDLNIELTTPTGAALAAALATGFGPLPAMTIEAAGFGAGSAEIEHRPNVTQVVIGQRDAELERGQPITLLEVNVDDITGEHLAEAIGKLLEAGAVDAWITPIVMKKGRPAFTVNALCEPVLAAQVRRALLDSTGSFGVRGQTFERWPEPRDLQQVEVAGLPVRIKVGAGRAKVEHDDAVRVARRSGLPLHEIVSLAEDAFRRAGNVTPIGSGAWSRSGLPTIVHEQEPDQEPDPEPDDAG